MTRTLWTLEDVTLSGDGGCPRLAGVSLDILSGTTAIVGPSGSGKTSLLNLLVGYESPDQGALKSGFEQGHAASGGSTFALPLFWVPQGGGLWPHLTALGHLEAVAPGGSADELRGLLAEFDIDSRAGARPDELSEGERSRLSVARALAADPAVLVMDEPLANVDPARAGRYWDVVREHVSGRGASLVFATHSPETVMRQAQNAVCVKAGRAIYTGDVETLYFRPETEEQARCLGAANWLSPEDARAWLGRDESGPRCFRPEHVTVRPDEDGPLVVRSSCFQGSVAEVELERTGTDERRRFFHRPAQDAMVDGLSAGTRVALRALLSIVVALAVFGTGGCGKRGGGAPVLNVKSWHQWQMPPDGARVPAPRDVEVGPGGEVLVLDTVGRVLIFDDGGKLLRSWRMPETERGRTPGGARSGAWARKGGGRASSSTPSRSPRMTGPASTSASTATTTACRSSLPEASSSGRSAGPGRGRASSSDRPGSSGGPGGSTSWTPSTTACRSSRTRASSRACSPRKMAPRRSSSPTTSRWAATARCSS